MTEWKCPTPACSSTEVEAVRIEPPVVDSAEPGLLRYSYDGYCPVCLVPLCGCFWVRADQSTAEEKPA